MRPSDFVDLRTQLVAWHDTPFAQAKYAEHHQTDTEYWVKEFGSPRGTTPRQDLVAHRTFLQGASLFLIDEHMVPLCIEAGRTLPPIDRVRASDFPSPNGLMFWSGLPIDKGFHDSGEVEDRVAVSWIAIPRDLDDAAAPGGSAFLTIYEDRDGGRYPGNAREQKEAHAAARVSLPRLVDVGEQIMTFGDTAADWCAKFDESWAGPLVRTMFATFMLMRQTLVVSERSRADRGTARRAERIGAGSDVSVLRLRRTKHATDDEGDGFVEWSCRWLVRGHWRQQWVPSEQVHRPTWIAPYVKGPEHLPLRIREQVTVLGR